MRKAAWLAGLEFCCGKLGSKLILVMGHTKCGAIAGATATYLASKEGKASQSAGSALEGLLVGLSGVAKQAEEELGCWRRSGPVGVPLCARERL